MLDGVQFGYGRRLVLDVPRLWIEQGSSVLLRGISGGGKSTLLGLLAGVLLPGKAASRSPATRCRRCVVPRGIASAPTTWA